MVAGADLRLAHPFGLWRVGFPRTTQKRISLRFHHQRNTLGTVCIPSPGYGLSHGRHLIECAALMMRFSRPKFGQVAQYYRLSDTISSDFVWLFVSTNP
jgi:hypothetical protein